MLTFQRLLTDPPKGAYAGSHARRGRLTLNHGVVETPIFMPVGTYGTVKGVMPASLEDMGAQIILATPFTSGCAQGWTSCKALAACTSSRNGTNRS